MKHFIFTIVAILTLASINAQKTTNGYYITQENDTVKVQIEFPSGVLGQNNFTNLIEVVENSNSKKKFTPTDIKGYGYSANGYKYVFLSKHIQDGSFKFLSPVFIGPKVSLYQYGVFTSGSGYSLASQNIFYTFEKSDNSYLFLIGRTTKKFRNELKEFFKDNPEAQRLIDDRLKYWLEMKKDLLEIMQAVNK